MTSSLHYAKKIPLKNGSCFRSTNPSPPTTAPTSPADEVEEQADESRSLLDPGLLSKKMDYYSIVETSERSN